MEQEDLVNAVNKIHASADLKAKAISGEPAPRRKNPVYTPLFKGAACFAAVAVIALGVIAVPRILKPVVAVAPASQGSSMASAVNTVNGLYHDSEIQNILVLGVDENQNDSTAHSDSMLMVSVDKRHNKLKVTSFLRDMYVKIPEHEANRLNIAYPLGGAPLTVKTIENNFGVDIDHYVTVDYSAFAKIIDRLGGVSITVTNAEAKLINQNSGEPANKRIAAGTALLTGKQALYYSRIRYIDTDFGRTDRQRKVAASIVTKLKSSNVSTITNLINDVLPLVTTDMNKDTILGLVQNAPTTMNYPVSQSRLPADGTYKDGTIRDMSVLVPDITANKQILAKFIYEEDSNGK